MWATHNASQSTIQAPYDIYTVAQGNDHYLQFGRVLKPDDTLGGNQAGYECGRMSFNIWQPAYFGTSTNPNQSTQDMANLANATQMEIVYTFARTLQVIGEKISTGHIDQAYLTQEFNIMKNASTTYVTTMMSNQLIFLPPESMAVESIDVMREQGWITAGNYYQVLASLGANYQFKVNMSNTPQMDQGEISGEYADKIAIAENVYDEFMKWPNKAYTQEQSPGQQARESIESAFESESEIFTDIGVTKTVASFMNNFINMISGEGGGATDPVLNAAHFGQNLMKGSMAVFLYLPILLPAIGFAAGVLPFVTSGFAWFAGVLLTVLPIVFGLMGFMYVQGAFLGVYLPLVPFVIFVIGVRVDICGSGIYDRSTFGRLINDHGGDSMKFMVVQSPHL